MRTLDLHRKKTRSDVLFLQIHLDNSARTCCVQGAHGRWSDRTHDCTCHWAQSEVGVAYYIGKLLFLAHKDIRRYMDPTFSHFVAVDGTASLCQHLLRDAVVRPRTMTAIEPVQEAVEHSGGWRVTASDGSVHTFNAVVITVPVPQALQISGVADLVAARGSDLDKRLSAVQYSSRWALAITLPFGAWESVHGLGWGVRYVSSKESESICYVAIDQLKRGWTKSESDPTLVVHGGVPWSLQKNADVARDREPVGLREEVEVRPAMRDNFDLSEVNWLASSHRTR